MKLWLHEVTFTTEGQALITFDEPESEGWLEFVQRDALSLEIIDSLIGLAQEFNKCGQPELANIALKLATEIKARSPEGVALH